MANKFQPNQDVYRKYIERVTVLYHSRQDVKMYAEILLSLFAVFIFGVFAIRPTVTTITGLYTEIQAKKKTLAQMETKKDALVAAQSLLRVQGLQVATLNQAVPNAPILEKQIRQLEGIAKRNQVAIIGISIAEVDLTGSGLVKVDEELVPPYQDSAFFKISVTVEGSYSTTSSFLRDVERMRRPISPIGVTFSEGSREDGNLNLNIIGLVPYLQK